MPTYLIGGWRDLFPAAVVGAHERISSAQLLVGPWLHVPPDLAAREPVDWMAMLLRFFDRHLYGRRAEDDPPVLVFVQGDGGWRAASGWPPAGAREVLLWPGSDGRLGHEGAGGADDYTATPLVGFTAGQWDTQGTGMGYPLDQGPDDLRSLTYTTEPWPDPLEIAGSPRAVLRIDRLDGEEPFDLVARLVDVGPDGRAELITTGWRRTHGGDCTISLGATAWRLARGHRLRLSIAGADFPRVWPNPTSPRLRLQRGGSTMRIPIATGGVGQPAQPPRPAPIPGDERFPWTIVGAPSWRIEHDLADEAITVTLGAQETIRLLDGGLLELGQRAAARVAAAHPAGASVKADVSIAIAAPGHERVEVEAHSRAARDRTVAHARVIVDGCTLVDRSWSTF